MKHIEKITINNARRFGENVEIAFGKGATILLAPNGTGKTTVFEAIELALTNSVERLKGHPDAIVRDGLSKMSVRLDFSEGKYCQVDYSKGSQCVSKGNYEELFRNVNKSSVPYLFRLTHFLEQRGREWFVEQGDKDAGNVLSQLPIGKELGVITKKQTSCLRDITAKINTVKQALKEAQRELTEFESLKAKRDGLVTKIALIPLKELVTKLIPIGNLINFEEYDGVYDVTLITTYFEKIRVSLQQEKGTKKALIRSLNELKERVLLYISNLALLNQKQIVIFDHSNEMAKLELIVEQIKKDQQGAKASLSVLNDEITSLKLDRSRFQQIEQRRECIRVNKTELEQNEKVLVGLTKRLQETVEYLKINARLQDQHRLANDEIKNRTTILTQIEQKMGIQKQWQEISKINQIAIKEIIPEIERIYSEYSESKSRLDKEVSEAEKVYLTKKEAVEVLNSASDAIQDAVSNIRKYLPENQRDCPVCQANYEPDDLIKRIESSLNKLNPAIPQAINDEEKSLTVFKVVKEKQRAANQKLMSIQSELNKESDKIKVNEKKILEIIIPQFSGCKIPEEANVQIEQQIALVRSEIHELEVNKRQLKPEVSIEKLNEVSLKKAEDERSIKELTATNQKLQNEITTETLGMNDFIESLDGKKKEVILVTLSDKSIESEQKINSIKKLEATLSKNEMELKERQSFCLAENEVVSKIKGSQEGIFTEWSQAGLKGHPNEKELNTKYELVSNVIIELEDANIKLNAIEQELASWRAAEKFHDADNEVKKKIGNSNEDAYLKSLETSVENKNSMLLKTEEKKKAVNLFLTNIKSESEQIHKQLNSINEPWKGLLKRIVTNPLISGAPLLSNTISRNIPKATTSANIHDQKVDISKIASEAQLTDLQLTLMLSLANQYKWTPWKALLLDDPTQHHDLVHASSVFDVLRDYIIDLDYQVMMSTHDSIQAKFFQRKLENEGVPSKIYQLVIRKGGIAAERM